MGAGDPESTMQLQRQRECLTMPHVLRPLSNKTLVQSYEGQSYKNAAGNAECVEFIKQTLNAPPTMAWQEGKKVILQMIAKDIPVM